MYELIVDTLITEPNQTLTGSEEDYPEGLIRVVSKLLLPWKDGAHPLGNGSPEVVLVDFGAGESGPSVLPRFHPDAMTAAQVESPVRSFLKTLSIWLIERPRSTWAILLRAR